MRPIEIPENYNYIAAFLTLSCNLGCSYCINRFNVLRSEKKRLTGAQWISGLDRIIARADLPVTLQGGEPSLHPDFYHILNGVRKEMNIDILTNFELDIDEFMKEVDPGRIRRYSPYASLRVSFHPEVMRIGPLAEKVLRLLWAGYSIGIWGVLHPDHEREIYEAQEYCTALGIDFRTKEFLGEYDGKICGTYRYPEACRGLSKKRVLCRTTELIIGPDGAVYRCHSDLYSGRRPVGNILDLSFEIDDGFRPCSYFGHCNPCDVKIKNNRFQMFGHTSVEIKMEEQNV